MKRLITGVALFGISMSANAVQNVNNTLHNLSGTAAGDNAEVCVYCHTPHGSDNTAAVPLWNRKLGDGTGFTEYDSTFSSTIDGAVDIGITAGSGYSLVCLSCHDGTQGVDVVVNQPGTDGYNAAGSAMGTNDPMDLATNGVTFLDVDLTNDHPIGIPYAGGGAAFGTTYAASTGTWGDTAFKAVTGVAATSSVTAANSLPLYKGTDGDAYVECASCHDPHEDTNPTFLRISNAASAVCTSCHIK